MNTFAGIRTKDPETFGIYDDNGNRIANFLGKAVSEEYRTPASGGIPTHVLNVELDLMLPNGDIAHPRGEATTHNFHGPKENAWIAAIGGTAANVKEEDLDVVVEALAAFSTDTPAPIYDTVTWQNADGMFHNNRQDATFRATIVREIEDEYKRTFYRVLVEENGLSKYITISFDDMLIDGWEVLVSKTARMRNGVQIGMTLRSEWASLSQSERNRLAAEEVRFDRDAYVKRADAQINNLLGGIR